MAEDGTIEAVSVPDATGFALAVQWHPEWQVLENPWSRRLFAAFGAAARARAAARTAPVRVRRYRLTQRRRAAPLLRRTKQ